MKISQNCRRMVFQWLVVAMVLLPIFPFTGKIRAAPAAGAAWVQVPGGVASDRGDTHHENIRGSEYYLTRQDRSRWPEISTAWQAANRAHNLRTDFSGAGIRVLPLGESQPSWDWGLSLVAYGYEGAIAPVAEAELKVEGNRVEFRRGALTEWYVNDRRGLEQGFTLSEPPGQGQRGTLVLELRTSGRLRPIPETAGSSVVLANAHGQVMLRYGALAAWDATGQVLPARMAVMPEGILIRVEDRAATYPLTVDPTVTQVQKLIAPDPDEYDFFGNAVAIDGDYLVVGMYGDMIGGTRFGGSAYVFVRNGGTWSFQAKLTADDGQAGDQFGFSVDVSRDLVAVGAPERDSKTGAVYLFRRSGTTWTQEDKLTPSDGPAAMRFGHSVAINIADPQDHPGDFEFWDVHVGAPKRANGGAVYLFELSPDGTVWNELGQLTVGPQGGWPDFGWSIDACGDYLVVGAPTRDDQGVEAGAAFTFRRTGILNAWSPWYTYYAGDASPGDHLGWSVAAYCGPDALPIPGAITPNFVAGAPREDGTGNDSGAAYLFPEFCQPWVEPCTERIKITAGDAAGGDEFGWSVAMYGSDVLVGATDSGSGGVGGAYLFRYTYGTASQQHKLVASDGSSGGDDFGYAVALDKNTPVVGDWRFNLPGPPTLAYAGSVYVFRHWSVLAPLLPLLFTP